MMSGPMHIDAEPVSLTGAQVECGVQNDLWDPPVPVGERTIAHLNDRGRQLKFDDDVVVNESGYRSPYVQVRGDFKLNLPDGPSIRADGADARLVDGRLGVVIQHTCFPEPLPLMGVRKGRFTQDTMPTMRFRLEGDGWHFDKFVH